MKYSLKIILTVLTLCAASQALAGRLDFSTSPQYGSIIAEARVADELRVTQSNCPSLSEAVEMVRRQYNGRIVSAETRMSGNREVHHIKVLTEDGKVKTVRIQGCSRKR